MSQWDVLCGAWGKPNKGMEPTASSGPLVPRIIEAILPLRCTQIARYINKLDTPL